MKRSCVSLLLCLLCTLTGGVVLMLPSCRFTEKETDNRKVYLQVLNTAEYFYRKNQNARAFHYLDSTYAAHPEAAVYDRYLKHVWKTMVYVEMEMYAAALVQADSMIALLQDKKDLYKAEYADALFVKGRTLVKLNDFNKAFQCMYDAKTFIEKQKDTCAYARYSGSLASVLYLQHKYHDAIRYMWEDFDRSGKCSEKNFNQVFVERQGSLDNIGLCYENLGLYDSAVYMYKMALEFIEKNGGKYPADSASLPFCRAVIKGNLGNTYMKMGKLAEAEVMLRENLAINKRQIYESLDAQFTMMKLARLFLQQKKYDSAYDIITHIRGRLDVSPNVDEEVRWRQLIWIYYDSVGDVANAYKYYRHYAHITDSIDAAARELPGADFNRSFYQIRQETQIASLKKENRFKNFYLVAFLVLSVMACVIVYLVYRNYRLSRANLLRQTMQTEQIRKQNETMQRTLTALEHSQEDNTKMLRVVAHDLHNPISAMVSLSDLLHDDEYGEEHRELVNMLTQSGENALKLIDNILRKKPVISKELVRLDELVQQSVGLLQFKADGKEQHLLTPVLEPLAVMVDREKIWRVINNLIVNAIKFSYERGEIIVSLVEKNGKAVLSVKDHGIGISDVMQGEVFNLYAMEGRKGTSGEESHGLGLSISKQVIDAHGGRIWFESEVGKGSTFYVVLDVSKDS